MNYFEENKRWKDFFISFLLLLAMVVVIFSFIGVSEGATNKDTVNKGPISKNLKIKSVTISNSAVGGIKGAVEKSKNGTTIYLKKRVYRFNNTNIKINKTLTIVGKGSTKDIIVDTRAKGRVFKISKFGKLNLINVTLKTGFVTSKYYKGGAIYNSGILSINGCKFVENRTNPNEYTFGGAIYNKHSLKLKNSVFKDYGPDIAGTIYCSAKYTTHVSKCKFINVGITAIYNEFEDYGSKIIVNGSYFKNCGIENYADYSKIINNKFDSNGWDIIESTGKKLIISHNIIIARESYDSDVGIRLFGDHNNVHNNKIFGLGNGISIVGVKNKVTNNKIFGKNIGIGISLGYADYSGKFYFSKYNSVKKNKVVNFEYGISIYKGFKTNKISYNKIINNYIAVYSSYKFKNRTNIFKGNKKNIEKI